MPSARHSEQGALPTTDGRMRFRGLEVVRGSTCRGEATTERGRRPLGPCRSIRGWAAAARPGGVCRRAGGCRAAVGAGDCNPLRFAGEGGRNPLTKTNEGIRFRGLEVVRGSTRRSETITERLARSLGVLSWHPGDEVPLRCPVEVADRLQDAGHAVGADSQVHRNLARSGERRGHRLIVLEGSALILDSDLDRGAWASGAGGGAIGGAAEGLSLAGSGLGRTGAARYLMRVAAGSGGAGVCCLCKGRGGGGAAGPKGETAARAGKLRRGLLGNCFRRRNLSFWRGNCCGEEGRSWTEQDLKLRGSRGTGWRR